ncbi:hypothethical protein (plasmid) [Ralstonia solanacearum CMR15]|nr:hypothethical protein [Ralstonia solanacearum CMR15]
MRIVFGGYVVGSDSSRTQLPVMIDPTDVAIAKTVAAIGGAAGVLEMRCDPAPEFGPLNLTLYSEGGGFLLVLTEMTDDGEARAKTLINKNAKNDLVCILGEKYPAKAVADDLVLVCSAFKEFAQTGTISKICMS